MGVSSIWCQIYLCETAGDLLYLISYFYLQQPQTKNKKKQTNKQLTQIS